MKYTCKKCNKPVNYRSKLVSGYRIKYKECGCGWAALDVLSPEGQSVKDVVGLKAVERMLHSEKSQVKIHG